MRRVSRLFPPPLLSALGSGPSLFYSDNHGPFSGGTFYGGVNAATGSHSKAYGKGSIHNEASGKGSAAGPNSGAFGDNYGGANVSGTGNTVHVDRSTSTHEYWTHIDPNYVGHGLVFLTMIWMYAAWGEAWQDCNKLKTTLNSLQEEEEKLRAELKSLERQGVKSTQNKYSQEEERVLKEISAKKKELESSLKALADKMERLPPKIAEAIRFSERNNLERLQKKLAELGFCQSPKIAQHNISQRIKVFFSKNKEEILLFVAILFYCFYSTDKLAEQFRVRLNQHFACLYSLLQGQPNSSNNPRPSAPPHQNSSSVLGESQEPPPTRVPHTDTVPKKLGDPVGGAGADPTVTQPATVVSKRLGP